MSEQERVDRLHLERQQDIQRLINAGLPGCLAMGYVPGGQPGKLRRADAYHELLVEALLRVLPEVPVH